jgi:hypothetical protein
MAHIKKINEVYGEFTIMLAQFTYLVLKLTDETNLAHGSKVKELKCNNN